MTRTKYQVFVSSTYEDLKQERNEVVKAILSMGHIPVGMEMFNAADDAQWEIIKRQIDQSDYYMVIVAHRYGSMVRGVSYTEREYNYAVEQGIPIMGFVIDNKASWPPGFVETDAKVRAKLEKFKVKVKKKPVNFWSNSLELSREFTAAFATIINTNSRPGWVRGTEVSGPDVANELGRLSKENAELREKLDSVSKVENTVIQQASVWLNTFVDIDYRIDYINLRNEENNKVRSISSSMSAYWYQLLALIFDDLGYRFTGKKLMTQLETIISQSDEAVKRTRLSPEDVKIVSCSVNGVAIIRIAEELMAHSIINLLPLDFVLDATWEVSEDAQIYRYFVEQISQSLRQS